MHTSQAIRDQNVMMLYGSRGFPPLPADEDSALKGSAGEHRRRRGGSICQKSTGEAAQGEPHPVISTSNWHRAVLWKAGAHTGFVRHRYLGPPPPPHESPHRILKHLSSLISSCSTTRWLSSCCYC
jgi:hypothetical protein